VFSPPSIYIRKVI